MIILMYYLKNRFGGEQKPKHDGSLKDDVESRNDCLFLGMGETNIFIARRDKKYGLAEVEKDISRAPLCLGL